jgi:hypothetical protein
MLQPDHSFVDALPTCSDSNTLENAFGSTETTAAGVPLFENNTTPAMPFEGQAVASERQRPGLGPSVPLRSSAWSSP